MRATRQHGADETFDRKLCDECLSLEWLRNRAKARVVIETWRRHYNHVRPHSSLKHLTPFEFKTRYDSINPQTALNLCRFEDPWAGHQCVLGRYTNKIKKAHYSPYSNKFGKQN
jgi:hypothetical protein